VEITGHKATIDVAVTVWDKFDNFEASRETIRRKFVIKINQHFPAELISKINTALLAIQNLPFVEEDD
jgi:hypothetical protein